MRVLSLKTLDAVDDVDRETLLPPEPSVVVPNAGLNLAAVAKGVPAPVETSDSLPEHFTLAEAMACRTFEARDPAKLPGVPQALVDVLDDAKTILLVGHTSPDADCAGSTLALARAMRLLGKRVDVCIDDDLPSPIRKLDDQNQIRRAKDLAGKSWDVALVMDTMVRKRMGGAVELFENADVVAVADHHQGTASASSIGVPDDKPFLLWSAPELPAAALMSAALIGRFDKRISARQHPTIYLPAIAGFATDVRYGELPTSNRDYFHYYKFMAERAGVSVEQLRDRLTVEVPSNVAEIMQGSDLEQRFVGPVPMSVITCPAELFDLMLDIAKLEDPNFNRYDLTLAFKDIRDQRLLERGGLGAFVYERGPFTVVSLRSTEGGHAHRIADALGGGGHKNSAAARIRGLSANEVVERVRSIANAVDG